tara:strand:+ start:2534 stop:3607 length:1074 start_codon:yes stop_codon:yes gene_type:complete
MAEARSDQRPDVMDYKSAGVDVQAGRDFVDRIKGSVHSTRRPEVIGGLGGFGGIMRLPTGLRQPLLVSGTDGVGTKLELAQDHHSHRGVGIDLVAMCVNDVITSGAAPLFFLDYMATGALSPDAMAEVIEGIADGCRQSDCALLGGETAEMPGFYPKGRYDLAGFCVAVVEAEDLIDGRRIQAGDKVIAIASSGVHSNGFSLVRRVLSASKADLTTTYGSKHKPLIHDLLQPTVLYPAVVKALLHQGIDLHGMAHITGGGLPENLPRCLPPGTAVCIDPESWDRPEVFDWLQLNGNIPERDMWHTFNLGVGFCLVLAETQAAAAINTCLESGHTAWCLGEITSASNDAHPSISGIPA